MDKDQRVVEQFLQESISFFEETGIKQPAIETALNIYLDCIKAPTHLDLLNILLDNAVKLITHLEYQQKEKRV